MISIVIVFVIGYFVIAFEHSFKLSKTASAMLTGISCWVIYALGLEEKDDAIEQLYHHMGEIAAVLFFLLGAMTIVELIDSHHGFLVLTERIKTKSKTKLLWIISILTFFLSAFLDNLTTAIVMTSLVGKILPDKEDRLWFTGMIVIAANAGGAFSPIGDVTTTMLWIGGQITTQKTIATLFLPSIFVCLVPLFIVGYRFRRQSFSPIRQTLAISIGKGEANMILLSGMLLLLFVPVFKTLTHLPPFMGVLFSLGVFWVIVSIIHFRKPEEEKTRLSVATALQKIDTPSILFFLGILLAVAALQSAGFLGQLGLFLNDKLGNIYWIGISLGVISSVVDNVPLVAAAQGMYDLSTFPADHYFWQFLALTTGTGGSAIIIGSAAGVAAMGIEQIEFMWYLRKISWLAVLGFIAGVAIFLTQTLI